MHTPRNTPTISTIRSTMVVCANPEQLQTCLVPCRPTRRPCASVGETRNDIETPASPGRARNFIMMQRLECPEVYTVGWIAALPIERAAATALLDALHDPPEGFEQHPQDTNSYTWGRIGEHNVAIASLPAGVYGTTAAATTASNLLSSLPQIRIGLLVGIGGGLARPTEGHDIWLGDVVVSQPDATSGGVVQYDLGKAKSGQKWQRKGSLNKPPFVLLHALSSLQSHHERAGSDIPNLLQRLWNENPIMKEQTDYSPGYVHQGFESDRLFQSKYEHAKGSTCDFCDRSGEVERKQRHSTTPRIHYGLIASGNTLIKDAITRDRISKVVGEGCMCFEMEAAGIMDRFPCIVIRGICDYADSHKNDRWQRYASATAAAYAKELLGFVPTAQLQATQRAIDAINSIGKTVENIESLSRQTREDVQIVNQVVHNNQQQTVLQRLSVAEGAAFDSLVEERNSTCLPNTRVDILKDIAEWANTSTTKQVFWLNGMAGTGKSTISRTIARSFAAQGMLGASFFFKRGEGDCGNTYKLVTTIAAQIGAEYPTIASKLTTTMESDSSVVGRGLREQFTKLVLEPLQAFPHHGGELATMVIIIDALDECDSEDDMRLIIDLFSRASSLLSVRLRTFITSRPELPIRLGFNTTSGDHQELVLHDMPVPSIEQDISTFLHYQLAKLRDEFNNTVSADRCLAPDWPGELTIQALTTMATPLFIFAVTTCRFLSDRKCGNPDKQLHEVLQFQTRSQESKLDATYLPILNKLISGLSKNQQRQSLEQFQLIIGTIINLASPLSISALADLLDLQTEAVADRLDLLHSVLRIPQSEHAPIRLLHLSFRDFLLDPDKREANLFWINEKESHKSIATNCLRVMAQLREDICHLKDPSTSRLSIDSNKLARFIPMEMQYACLFWVHHLQEAGKNAFNGEQVYNFLTCHFLHWIEVLGFVGRSYESIKLIKDLMLLSTDNSQLLDFLDDAHSFVLMNASVINSTPLQVYSSLLVFAPQNSKVRTVFAGKIPHWIILRSKLPNSWHQHVQTLEGHRLVVEVVAFSHDSKLLVSGSMDETIRIWSATTGECMQIYEDYMGVVKSVAFSHDSKFVVSGSSDRFVRIWSTHTGERRHILKGHERTVESVAFSHDSKLVVSCSKDGSIRIWSAKTGKCTRIMGQVCYASSHTVAFSHDSKLVVSCSLGGVKIWSTDTDECKNAIFSYYPHVQRKAVAISPDMKLIATVYDHDATPPIMGGIVEIRCTDTGQCLHKCHAGATPMGLAFSHDSKRVVSCSGDNYIRVWSTSTGDCVQELRHNGGFIAIVSFSPDSQLLGLTTSENIQILRTSAGECDQDTLNHSSKVMSVGFSPNSMLIASTAKDGTIRIWRADTGEFLYVLESQVIKGANPVTFSGDSELIATVCSDGSIRVRHAKTGECIKTLKDHRSRAVFLGFSRGSTMTLRNHPTRQLLLASTHEDGTIRIWRLDRDECMQTLEGHSMLVNIVVFSHNTKLLASASEDQSLRFWSVDTGECTRILDDCDSMASMAFSLDSKLVLCANWYGFIQIHSADTGECVQAINLENYVNILSFDMDTTCLATSRGVFTLPKTFSAHSSPYRTSGVIVRNTEVGISKNGHWITFNGKNILWLPPECRSYYHWAVCASTIVIGCPSGRVIIIEFSCSGISKILGN